MQRKAVFVKTQPADIAALEDSVRSNPADSASIIQLAEQYYKTNHEPKILDLFQVLDSSSLSPKSAQKFRYYTLKALAHAHSGELSESEQLCEQGLLEFPDAMDFYYILSFIKLSMREYKTAIECAEKYLQLLKTKPVLDGMPLPLCGSKAHLSQLENILGNAFRESKQVKQAIEHYQAAIKSDPANHLPYLNLVSTHTHLGDNEKAKAVVEQGLAKCNQVQDLRILKQSLENHCTVSACMIVKNEEKLLPDCLESIRDWVDEIIIVDTGSTDKTVEIAETYGAKIFHQEWEGNFSKHRNYSLEQATSEWIFIIDADERICTEDVPRLRELINSDQHQIISINVFNVYGDNQEITTFLPSIRLFKRDLNLRYEGIVHNRLSFAPDAAVVRANIGLKHLGYDLSPDKMKNKFERSKALLEKQLESKPDDAFALFNLAQLLRGVGRNNPAQVSNEIIQYAERAVELTSPDELLTRNIHLMSLDQLAWAYFYKKDYPSSRDYAERAISYKRDYLDPLLLLGHVYTQQQDFEKARDAYLKYIEVQEHYDPTSEKDNLIIVNPDSRTTAYYGLGMLYEIQNNPAEALNYYRKTAELNPNYLEVQKRISLLAKKSDGHAADMKQVEKLVTSGQFEQAESLIQKLVGSSSNKDGIIEQSAQLYFAHGHYHEAAKYFWQLLDSRPNDPAVLNDLANCHFKMNEFEKALEYYETASELPDAPPILYRNLGVTCSRLKQYGSAIVAFRKYIDIYPDDVEIYSIMAELYCKTSDFAAALPLYEKSLQVNSTDYTAVFNLSECYLNLGHEESAKLGYYRVLELKPDFEPAQKRITQLEAVASES